MRLVILGGPGAGKGTQGEWLCQHLGISWVSTGDILRAAIAAKDSDGDCQTELGRQARSYVERGELVPDDIMIQFIQRRLSGSDLKAGWVLDGYPRTAFQAEELDFLLEKLNQHLDYALFLEVPVETLLARSLARAREDDTPEAIQRRLEAFQARTVPLLEYYEMKQRLLYINAELPIEQVRQEILEKLTARA
ncbi:MAG TPA: adenylate kinase [Leptolyngbyaceae cyanobacterium M33_DOE_097]|uniref:Adenylate kinase n=1 Tax=Oscillatoriales cyanobacterium SpSt-418 TaxID=2282169 RepID=A0A7C3KHP7_9CYAN|nr:adenylate kinase [Leptolyngbyaceae cyanobacterium M33_DOE_097]